MVHNFHIIGAWVAQVQSLPQHGRGRLWPPGDSDLSWDITCGDDDTRWLIAHADQILTEADLPTEPLRLSKHFRQRFTAERSRLLCELASLRVRGRAKFSAADQLFFTRAGLEQSTDETIAAYKSSRFPSDTHIADLCCGIGGDAMSLARGRALTLVDRDSNIAAIAQANLATMLSRSIAAGPELQPSYAPADAYRVLAQDIRELAWTEFDGWHLDPDRRHQGTRRSAPDACEPPLHEFLSWSNLPAHGAIKLAPAAAPTGLLSQGVQFEWIGHQRECQQLVAWFGDFATHPGRCTATWLERNSDGKVEVTCHIGEPGDGRVGIGEPGLASVLQSSGMTAAVEPGQFLYEPQPSVLAAGLASSLAWRHGILPISANIPYFLSKTPLEDDRLLRRFEVLSALPYRKGRVKDCLKQLDAHVVEVKKRGVDIDPQQLRKELATEGNEPVTIFLYPRDRSIMAVLARRSPQSAARS